MGKLAGAMWLMVGLVGIMVFSLVPRVHADPSIGQILDASLSATVTPANIVFSVHIPQSYLQICNDSAAGGANIGINPTGAASIGTAGTHTLFPGGCQTFETNQISTNTWSVVSSGTSPVTVWYR